MTDFWITTTSASAAPGSSPYAGLLHHMVDAVGHAPQMPYYATGFVQCKDRYRNQSQLLAVANGYASAGYAMLCRSPDPPPALAQLRLAWAAHLDDRD